MSDKLPSDFEAGDSFRESDAMDLCADCGLVIHQTEYTGPIYDVEGVEYEHYTEADAMDRPYFCQPCWERLETNQKQQQNAQLSEWS